MRRYGVQIVDHVAANIHKGLRSYRGRNIDILRDGSKNSPRVSDVLNVAIGKPEAIDGMLHAFTVPIIEADDFPVFVPQPLICRIY